MSIRMINDDSDDIKNNSYDHYQWRIQDFPEEGAPTSQGGGANIQFRQIFPKTA